MEITAESGAAEAQPTSRRTAPHRVAALLRMCAASFGDTAEPQLQNGVDWNDVESAVDMATEYVRRWLDDDDCAEAFDALDLLTIAKVALQAGEIPDNELTNSPICGLLRVTAQFLEDRCGRPGREDPLPDLEDAVLIVERIAREHPYMDSAAAEQLGQAVGLLRETGEQLYQAGLRDVVCRSHEAEGSPS